MISNSGAVLPHWARELATPQALKQIATLQLCLYFPTLLLASAASICTGEGSSLGPLLDWEVMETGFRGVAYAVLWVLNPVFNSLAMYYLFSRPKHAGGIIPAAYAIHVVAVSVYSRGVPLGPFWWLTQATSMSVLLWASAVMQRVRYRYWIDVHRGLELGSDARASRRLKGEETRTGLRPLALVDRFRT